MAEVLLSERLNQVIDSLHNAPDEQARVAAFDQANEIMQGFVSGELELDPGALDTFGEFLENFAGITDEAGNQTLSELGTRALAKYEALINNREGEHGNESPDAHMVQNRIYSLNSDANQIVFDRVSFVTLQSMGLIDANINPNDMRADQISSAIDAVNLTDEQKIEYASRFVDAVIADTALFETVPPKILADAYTATRRALLSATDDATRQANQRRFNTLASRIDFLIENFSTQLNYWYVDPSNLMSLRDGYQKMFDVRQPDLQDAPNQNDRTREYNRRINGMIDSGRASLLAAIHEYEELYHLTQINPENAEELKQRWIELKSRLGEIEITPETMAVAAKYHFLDEAGNPIPQFLDENNQPSLEFTEGCKLNPTGRLAQVINLSRNDVVMENVADLEHSVADMELDKMLDEEVPWTFSEISIPDQVVQGIVQDPNKMRDEAAVQEFWDGIRTDGGSISDTGYQAALDAHVNHAIGFAHALGERVGTDQDVVYMPVEAVEEIDRLATTRTEVEGAENRKQKIGFFKRMAKNFGMASVVSAGLTFLGKATGVAYIGAAVGTTIGVGNMIYQGLKWRKEQKAQGKPHGIKDFLSDKRNWGPAVTTGLGIAATISMATGNPELAMGFGLGAMTVGTGTSVAMTYKDAVAAGYSRGQALAGAIGVGASGILGAAFGNTVMNGIVNYVNNNTDSTLFKHPETVETTRTEYETHTERVYEDGVIERHENMMLKNNWETPQSLDARIDALMDAGLSRDDSVRYLVAFHDATDHNLGPGYFDSIGMSDSGLAALRNSINGTEVNLTPESIAAFEHFNPHISAQNQVGYIPGAPVDYTLPPNAAYDANGVLVHGNELYTTYANHDAPIFHDVTYQTPITITDTATIFTPNELAFPAGIGTFGIYEPRVVPAGYIRRLRERAGALADRIIEVPEPTPDPVPDPEPDPVPDPEPDPVPDPEPDPVPDPEPDPVPDPVPDPEPDPVPDPEPDPVPDPEPDPVPDPEPDPVPDPEPDPVPDPEPDPVPDPVPDPEPDPVPDPEPDPVPDPVPDPEPDPVPDPEPDPVPDPEPDPVPDPEPDPVPDPEPDPVPDPEPDPVPDPEPDPVPDPVPDPEPDPVPDPEPDPVPDPEPDPVPDPEPDPVPDPEPDPVPDPEPDPVPDPEPDPVPDPEPDPVPPVPDPGPDGPVVPPKPPRPKPDSDLMVDIKLNQKPHQANANNNVAVKVDGKIEEVKVFSSVDGNTMKVTMIVPYSMDMDNGYYQPVYKTFSGDLRQVTVKSRATKVGMRIDMVFDGVSMHDKGRHKIYFRHVTEEGRQEHTTTLTKKTRFNRANVLDRNAVEEPKPEKKSKKDAFNQGAATLEDMPPAEYARLKEQRAKKPENIAAWAKARSAIEALNAQTDLTEQEKAERAAQILAAAQRAVNG